MITEDPMVLLMDCKVHAHMASINFLYTCRYSMVDFILIITENVDAYRVNFVGIILFTDNYLA